MRKTYLLAVEGKNRDRLLEAAKHDMRKYVKRERARPLPLGVDFWDFDCKVGAAAGAAELVHLAAMTAAVDALVSAGVDQFYAEIVTKQGRRMARAAAADAGHGANDGDDGDDLP